MIQRCWQSGRAAVFCIRHVCSFNLALDPRTTTTVFPAQALRSLRLLIVNCLRLPGRRAAPAHTALNGYVKLKQALCDRTGPPCAPCRLGFEIPIAYCRAEWNGRRCIMSDGAQLSPRPRQSIVWRHVVSRGTVWRLIPLHLCSGLRRGLP